MRRVTTMTPFSPCSNCRKIPSQLRTAPGSHDERLCQRSATWCQPPPTAFAAFSFANYFANVITGYHWLVCYLDLLGPCSNNRKKSPRHKTHHRPVTTAPLSFPIFPIFPFVISHEPLWFDHFCAVPILPFKLKHHLFRGRPAADITFSHQPGLRKMDNRTNHSSKCANISDLAVTRLRSPLETHHPGKVTLTKGDAYPSQDKWHSEIHKVSSGICSFAGPAPHGKEETVWTFSECPFWCSVFVFCVVVVQARTGAFWLRRVSKDNVPSDLEKCFGMSDRQMSTVILACYRIDGFLLD